MVKYKIMMSKEPKLYYARRYSDRGFLLDSLASGTMSGAQKTIKNWKSASIKKDEEMWYFGTRHNKWYLLSPKDVPEYKKGEGISQALMKKIGQKKAKELALAPTILRGGFL